MAAMATQQTLFDKVWSQHVITSREDGQDLLFIYRHFIHDVTATAFDLLRQKGLRPRSPERTFAIGLGCDVRHASRLVYAKGLALSDPQAATPIGAGCKVCDRQGCPQRAFPALGKRLRIDENERSREPYAAS